MYTEVYREPKSVNTASKASTKSLLCSAQSFCSRILRRLKFVGAEVVHHLLRDFCQDTLSQSFFGRLIKKEHKALVFTTANKDSKASKKHLLWKANLKSDILQRTLHSALV